MPYTPPLVGYTIQFGSGVVAAPVDATTYFSGNVFNGAPPTTGALRRLYIPRAGIIRKAYITFTCVGLGSNETSTVSIRLNDTSDTTVSTAVTNDANFVYVNNTALAISVAQGDYVEIKWTTPSWATNPTNVTISGIIYVE